MATLGRLAIAAAIVYAVKLWARNAERMVRTMEAGEERQDERLRLLTMMPSMAAHPAGRRPLMVVDPDN